MARILVVEDDPIDQELLAAAFRESSFPIEATFISTETELEAKLVKDIAVLVTDFKLVGFTASKVLRKAKEVDPAMPVIVITGAASEEESLLMLGEGAFSVIQKSNLKRVQFSLRNAIHFRTLQRELERKERYWRSLIENSSDAVITLSASAEIIYSSPAVERLLGYKSDESLGKSLFEFLHPDDHLASRAVLEQVFLDPSRPVKATARVRHANGSWRIMEGFINNRLSDPAIGAIVDNFWDVTEAQNTLQNLSLFDECLSQLDEGVLITDANLDSSGPVILYANAATERLTGYSRMEIIGKTPRMFQGTNTSEDTRNRLRDTLSSGKSFHGELHNYRKDGTEFLVEMNIAPVFSRDKLTHFIAIQRDVTQIRKNQEVMARTDRIQTIGFLSSGIAHDLNNILTPIALAAELLQMDKAYDQNLTDTIANSARRGTDIIKHLLAFARGAKTRSQSLSSIPLLIKEMGSMVKETFPKDIQWNPEVDSATPPVLIEPAHLHQILLNLCVNARDAMPRGGMLRVSCGPVQLDEAQAAMISKAKPGLFARIAVQDFGSGIAPENVGKIFDTFFTTKEPGKGTGIGLPTVLGLVEEHGGFMRVQTEFGSGSTFEIYLPASEDELARPPAPASFPSLGKGETVLVVDDEPAVRSVIKSVLTSNNYKVIIAEDGADALGLFARQPENFQLILSDLMMPHLDGLGFIKAVRRLSPSTPVVAMTGAANKIPEPQLRDLGIRGLLSKPFGIPDLLHSISSALKPR